mgnify:FL=1
MIRTIINLSEESREIRIYGVCPMKVPERRLAAAAELVVRLNNVLPFGHFDLDLDTAVIAMRTGIRIGRADLDSEVFKHLLFLNWAAIDFSFPAIAAVLSGAMTPQEAIAMLEKDKQTEHDDAARGEDRNPNRPDFNDRIRRFTDFSNN